MSNKFHQSALTDYTRSYARRVCADFFSNHTFISGKQILNLTPIGQINMFIVSNLFDKWKADAEKFRSPYFDFTQPEVEEAMRAFMNVVSQHIAVRREYLEPMLADALRRTLTLIFDPRYYFDELLRNQPDFTLTADAAKQIVRYTQINKFVATNLAERMNGKPFMYVNQALNSLDEILSQRAHDLERYDRYVAILSEKVPIDINSLLRTSPDLVNGGTPARSFFDSELETTPAVGAGVLLPTTANDSLRAGVQPSADETDRYDQNPGPVVAPTAPATVASVVTPEFQIAEPQTPPITGAALAKETGYQAPRMSLEFTPQNQQEESTSVAEAFHRAPIESIVKSISLNQKFRFINQLFGGSSTSYAQAIDELDQMENYGQALDLISYRYASQYLWDMSSDEVSELVEILKRRFA